MALDCVNVPEICLLNSRGLLMPERTVNNEELLDDIHSGMDDRALIEKYKLSAQQLKSLFEELVESGSVRVDEMYRSDPITPKLPPTEWKCPRCSTPLTSEFQVCPKCKVYIEVDPSVKTKFELF